MAESGVAYPLRPVVAVGAVVIRERKVLLVRRAKPPNAGLWAIPGGAVELGESLQVAAERELYEETNVVIRAGDPVFTFDCIDRDAKGAVRYHYVIIDLLCEYLGGEPQAQSDALDARWISVAELEALPVSENTLTFLRHHLAFGEGVAAQGS